MEWRKVPDWPYEVSEYGDVRRVGNCRGTRHGRILKHKIQKNKKGKYTYHKVILSEECFQQHAFIHRLVAICFISSEPPDKPHVLHIDGNTHNNHYSNLKWGEPVENSEDAKLHGTFKYGVQFGEEHGKSVLTLEQVRTIKNDPRPRAERVRVFANLFGFSTSTISNVVYERCWKWV